MVENKTDLGVKGVFRDIGTLHEVPKVYKVEVSPHTSTSTNTSPSTLPLLHPSKSPFLMQCKQTYIRFCFLSQACRQGMRWGWMEGPQSTQSVSSAGSKRRKQGKVNGWISIPATGFHGFVRLAERVLNADLCCEPDTRTMANRPCTPQQNQTWVDYCDYNFFIRNICRKGCRR